MVNIGGDVNGTKITGNRIGYRDIFNQIDDDRRSQSASIDNT
jgi:hypothetical protein